MAGLAAGTTSSSERPPSPPTVKGRDTRRRLLEAGKSVLSSRGYARARVVDVTEAAGLSPGAFYRYFTDKHDLVLVLLQETLDEAFAAARSPWDDEHPAESVQLTTERYFDFYERNRALMGTMVELAQNDPQVRSMWQASRTAFYQRIARALAHGVGSGVIRNDIDVVLAAELLGSMTEFYAFQRYALGDDAHNHVPAATVAGVLAEIWAHGMHVD